MIITKRAVFLFIFSVIAIIVFYSFHFHIELFFYVILYILGILPFFIVVDNVLKNKIKVFDPIIIVYLIIFQMFGVSFFVILADPMAHSTLYFGGSSGSDLDFSEFAFLITKSQSILTIFSLILFFSNKKNISWKLNFIKKKSDIRFAKILLALSFFILIPYIVNLKHFILSIGTIDAFDFGATFTILSRGCVFFSPMIILILNPKIKWGKYFLFILIFSMLELFKGSRSGFLYFIFFSLQYYWLLGKFKPSKKSMLVTLLCIILGIGLITAVRAFNKSHLALNSKLTNINNISFDYGNSSSSNGLLLTSDRIKPIALGLYYLDLKNKSWSYGETIIARPIEVLNIYLTKIGLPPIINIWTADMYTHYWRFGKVGNDKADWSVPLSIPGEFYFQFGYFSLIFLSLLFGKLIFYFRKKLSNMKPIFNFFFLYMLVLYLAKSISSELMLYSNLFLLVLPIFYVVYKFNSLNN